MEMEEQMPTPDFLKGFNEGYIMAKHEPELSAKIAGALGDTERAKGFQGGQKQYMDEIGKERYPSWLTKDHVKSFEDNKQRSKDDLEKGKD